EVDRRVGLVLALGRDRFHRPFVGDGVFHGGRDAVRLAFLVLAQRLPQVGAGVEDVAQDRGAAGAADDQAVAVLRARVVLGAVAGDADEQVLVRGELGRQAGRRHILVVVFAAGGQVLAEAVALEAGEGAADARRFRNRSAGGGDDLFLAV